jgi:ATP-binding cassette subfamily C protein
MRLFQRELTLATHDAATEIDARYPEGDIVFENVTYQHAFANDESTNESGRGGIRNLELTIKEGEFLAVTGPSGIGKTTVADLLAGLYAPQSGRILVGTQLLEPAIGAIWRRELAYVSQDPFLFHDSIRRNLAWAKPNADERELWRVLAAVDADKLVRQMDGGLDSIVGERGSLISGGERQRIALARALLRNPRLIILDEATSALDSESEATILTRLSMLRPRPTIVLIAQRTENLSGCDRVMRLEIDGQRTVASAIVPRAMVTGTPAERGSSVNF